MATEEFIEKAKQAGWKVRDNRQADVVTPPYTTSFTLLDSDNKELYAALTENELWERLYVHLMNNPQATLSDFVFPND